MTNEYNEKLTKQLFENDCKKMEKKYGTDKLKMVSELIYRYFNKFEVVLVGDDNCISATIYVDETKGQKITGIYDLFFYSIEFVAEYLEIDINLYIDTVYQMSI